MTRHAFLLAIMVTLFPVAISLAGPFVHTTLDADDPSIQRWAKTASLLPGPHGASTDASAAIGPADGGTTSLGELATTQQGTVAPGQVTVSFGAGSIFDGPGDDFVVFENAFAFSAPNNGFWFAELAFVEVSSNGTDFARYTATSLNTEGTGNPATDIITPFQRPFAGVDPTNINGLAGFDGPLTFGGTERGTAFDLADLAGNAEVVNGSVDLGAIRFIRLIDILGDGSVLDSFANPILDAFDAADPPGVNGFDLDAVGALNSVPEPAGCVLGFVGVMCGLAARRRQRREV